MMAMASHRVPVSDLGHPQSPWPGKPAFVYHQMSPREVLYNRRRVYIVAAESVTPLPVSISWAPRPALINTASNKDLSKHNHFSFLLLPCGPLSRARTLSTMSSDSPRHVLPRQRNSHRDEFLVRHFNNPNTCECGRYIFLKSCGCFFESFAFKCGARYSPTGKIAFCRSPAPKHQVTKVRMKVRCVLHPPPQVSHHHCPQQKGMIN